jgi:lipoprotein-anchoring transpeptidase ErfK/SrfK
VCVAGGIALAAMIGPAIAGAGTPDTSGADTSAPDTAAPDTGSGDTVAPTTATTIAPATRGSTIQLVTTLPPPPTVATLPTINSPYPVPANSGTGRRVVYSKSKMRVWIIEDGNRLVRTYLVSGRLDQPLTGSYSVYSRSSYTCNINHPNVCMRWMVRFAKGTNGDNIGFHEIPRKDGVPIQTESQLGMALSSGCVRQSTADAWFMWNWAYVGTRVVVVW